MKTENIHAEEALMRAQSGHSMINYNDIFTGFGEKGIHAADIIPRVNVFTYNAWSALGRQVKKGEHGVKVITWVPMTKKSKVAGEADDSFRRPKSATVFHISQTEVAA